MIRSAAAAEAEPDRRVAFSRLVDRDLDRSYRIAGVILGNGQDAEDATHDAVVQAWQRFGSLHDPDRFDAWFQRILVNVCRDRLRRRRRWPVVELDLTRERADDPDAIAGIDEHEALGRAFAQLNPDQRLTVALRFYADLTVEEIADRMRVPAGTVKSRLHAATRRLQEELGVDEEIAL